MVINNNKYLMTMLYAMRNQRNVTYITWHTHQNGKWLNSFNSVNTKKNMCALKAHRQSESKTQWMVGQSQRKQMKRKPKREKQCSKWDSAATIFGEIWNRNRKRIKTKQNKSHTSAEFFFFLLFLCTFSVFGKQWKLPMNYNLNCSCFGTAACVWV